MWVILLVRNWPDVPRTMHISKRTFRNVWHVLGGGFGRPGGMQSLLLEAGDHKHWGPCLQGGERGECGCSVPETKYEDKEGCLKPAPLPAK